MTWRTWAACRDTDPATFYTPDIPLGRPTRGKPDPYAAARTICDGCPVTADCLTDAVTTGDPYGFRGGKTPDQIGDIIARRTGGDTTKVCEMCGGSYTAGSYGGIRRYCGPSCAREAERAAKRTYQRRVRGAVA